MFKPGDTALVVGTGKQTTVVAVPRGSRGSTQWPVETEDGIYDESELRQAHPSVLSTANAESHLHEFFKDSDDPDEKSLPKINRDLHLKVSVLLKSASLDVDVRGHWKSGAAIYDFAGFKKRILSELWLFGFKSDEDATDLQEAIRAKKALNRWIPLGSGGGVLGHDGCSYCGAKRLSLETDGLVIRIAGEPCALPNGFEPNEWELNVPSGKIVVANDLREWFPLPEGDGEIESVNTVLGCRQTAQAYAAVGMAHAFVGNTCPGVFKISDEKFKIASEPAEEYWDGTDWVAREEDPNFEGERVAGICTDLWWYSLCDFDEFHRRAKKFGGSLETARAEVIDVTPGVYKFKHHDDVDRDLDDGTVYAEFEWVREPDPVKDLLKSWDEVEVNAHAFVQAQVRRWPTLFGVVRNAYRDNEKVIPWSEMTEDQRNSSWQRVADHTLCSIGNGVKWHEKGFPQSCVDPSVPDIDPPTFRRQCGWRPFSENYSGLFRSEPLAPSFAKLALRVLESVISFGTNVHDDSRCRGVHHVRDRMMLAVKRYRELAKVYADFADPDYVWWLEQPGRAEAWVERFDLGPTFTEKHKKHIEAQRWVPEDAYAIEFDARKLTDGHFAWAKGYWAKKEDAERYAINHWQDNGQPPEHNCFWTCHAGDTVIPLYSVARVVKVGEVSHMGETLVELAFDYGTEWMTDPTKRKAVRERTEKDGIRVLTKEEYEKLLPRAELFFKVANKKSAKRTAKKAPKKRAKKTAAKKSGKKSTRKK